MRTVFQHITLHSLTTFHHANTRGSRLEALVCLKICCHPSVMSRSLPHSTLTTSPSSLSSTSPILQSSFPTHPSVLTHDPYLHCDDSRRSCGFSDLPSPTDLAQDGQERSLAIRNPVRKPELYRKAACALPYPACRRQGLQFVVR